MVGDEKNRSLNPINNEVGSRSNSPAAPTPTHLLRAQRQHSYSYSCPLGQTLYFVQNKPKRGVPRRMYRASGSVCR